MMLLLVILFAILYAAATMILFLSGAVPGDDVYSVYDRPQDG